MSESKFIVYACPTGPLSDRIDQYFEQTETEVGTNKAHAYMPHVTLTGFFPDPGGDEIVKEYGAWLEAALDRARPTMPSPPLVITGLNATEAFHGITLESAWIEALVADFKAHALSDTRPEEIRLKSWLHCSLAYGFPAEQHEALLPLTHDLIDLALPVGWDLRFYERKAGNAWVLHHSWTLNEA